MTEKYDGKVRKVPIIKTATFNGVNEFGISTATYKELTGEECKLKNNEVMAAMESDEKETEGKESLVTEEATVKLFGLLKLGKTHGEIATPHTYEEQGYQKVVVKKIVSKNIIGQMVDGNRDSWVVWPDHVYNEARERILHDKEEPSILLLFQIPKANREAFGKELKEYVDREGTEEFGALQESLYDIEDIIKGIEGRNWFQFSSKIFIIIALLIGSLFILKMKVVSELGATEKKYSFLTVMGMKTKRRKANVKFEIRSVVLLTMSSGFFMVCHRRNICVNSNCRYGMERGNGIP